MRIFDPVNIEVKKIKKIGKIFINIKKINFLSFKLILNLIFLTKSHIKRKNGVSNKIYLNKKVIGYTK